MSLRPHSPQIYLIQINSFNILNSDMLKSTLFSSYSEISMKNNITLTMASEISKYNLFHSLFKKKKKTMTFSEYWRIIISRGLSSRIYHYFCFLFNNLKRIF